MYHADTGTRTWVVYYKGAPTIAIFVTGVASIINTFLAVANSFIIALVLRHRIRAVCRARRVDVAVDHSTVNSADRGIIYVNVEIATGFERRVNPTFSIMRCTVVASMVREAMVYGFRPNGYRANP